MKDIVFNSMAQFPMDREIIVCVNNVIVPCPNETRVSIYPGLYAVRWHKGRQVFVMAKVFTVNFDFVRIDECSGWIDVSTLEKEHNDIKKIKLRPMSEAPKDGTPFFVHVPKQSPRLRICHYSKHITKGFLVDNMFVNEENPSIGWIPIPSVNDGYVSFEITEDDIIEDIKNNTDWAEKLFFNSRIAGIEDKLSCESLAKYTRHLEILQQIDSLKKLCDNLSERVNTIESAYRNTAVEQNQV